MAKKGLSRECIVDAAAQLAEDKGLANLTLHELAGALGVKTASLYNHLQGMPELNARLTERAFERMLEALRQAEGELCGGPALRALAGAYREFARSQPQLYKVMLAVPRFQETRIVAQKQSFMELFRRVLLPYGLSEQERVHMSRMLRSSLHGFVSLEAAGFFAYPVEADESYGYLVQSLCAQIERLGGAQGE